MSGAFSCDYGYYLPSTFLRCSVLIVCYKFTKIFNYLLSLTTLRFSQILAQDPITRQNLKFVNRNLHYGLT